MYKRSAWKLPFVSNIFFDNKIFNFKASNFKLIKRGSCIPFKLLKCVTKISVYSGKTWKSFNPRAIMLGFKLGEFCFTKVFGKFVALSVTLKSKKKKQDKKKK